MQKYVFRYEEEQIVNWLHSNITCEAVQVDTELCKGWSVTVWHELDNWMFHGDISGNDKVE